MLRFLTTFYGIGGDIDMSIVIGLAAYNEETSIDPLFTRIASLLEREPGLSVILYNDGSSDETEQRVQAWEDRLPIRYLRGETNQGLGQGIAVITSTFVEEFTASDLLLTMDCDDTHDPGQVLSMIEQVRDADVVIASRYQPGSRIHGLSMLRRTASRVFSLIAAAYLRVPRVRDYTSGFRLYRHGVLSAVYRRTSGVMVTQRGFACMPELLVHCAAEGAAFDEVPLELHYGRRTSASKMRFANNALMLLRLLPHWKSELKHSSNL